LYYASRSASRLACHKPKKKVGFHSVLGFFYIFYCRNFRKKKLISLYSSIDGLSLNVEILVLFYLLICFVERQISDSHNSIIYIILNFRIMHPSVSYFSNIFIPTSFHSFALELYKYCVNKFPNQIFVWPCAAVYTCHFTAPCCQPY
jgi:hypothetical protein